MKTIIHINKHNVRSNAKVKKKDRKPVITCKTYKSNDYGNEVEIKGPCKIHYTPDDPLKCGAKVYITTQSEVIILS